jgi:hypothetical protein
MTVVTAFKRVKDQLRRIGATDACIWCGMPDVGGTLTWAHIHPKDRALASEGDLARVFRLCWQHHHGAYDQGYISTAELIAAEDRWIAGSRPQPHPRDIELMRRVAGGSIQRDCRWTVSASESARARRRKQRARAMAAEMSRVMGT